jgi:hypothetical protein
MMPARLFLTLISACALGACASAQPKAEAPRATAADLPSALQALGLRSSFSESYKVSDQSEVSGGGIPVDYLTAEAQGGRVIRVEKIATSDRAQADKFVNDKALELARVYEPHTSPYFAAVTNKSVCPYPYRLQHKKSAGSEGARFELYALFANDRMTYGACSQDQATYRAFVTLLECVSSNRVFVLESFVPVKQLAHADEQDLESLRCP